MILTVIGMHEWPLPDGVNFLGILSPEEVVKLYDSHDLLVMPSRLEPSDSFSRKLSHAACRVARNACAMPEIVTSRVSGALIDKDDEDELTAAIILVLSDEEIYAKCRDRAPGISKVLRMGTHSR